MEPSRPPLLPPPLSQSSDNSNCGAFGSVCDQYADCVSDSCVCRTPYFTGDGKNCTDVNECAANGGRGDCDARATCTNTVGGRTCACDSANGWSGNGLTCRDVRAPVLTLSPANPTKNVTAYAALGASSKLVTFTAFTLSASDNNDAGTTTITCTALLGGTVTTLLNTTSFPATIPAAEFPVGTTVVTCVAQDGASPPNSSPGEAFAVIVDCVSGDPRYAFVPGTGCIGERAAAGASVWRRGKERNLRAGATEGALDSKPLYLARPPCRHRPYHPPPPPTANPPPAPQKTPPRPCWRCRGPAPSPAHCPTASRP
jgi:hypothetical protein